MTITETRPEAERGPSAVVVPPEPSGVAGFLMTVDHKRIGRAYVVVAVLLLVAAAVVGELIGAERVDSEALDVFVEHLRAVVHRPRHLGRVPLPPAAVGRARHRAGPAAGRREGPFPEPRRWRSGRGCSGPASCSPRT